MDVLRKLFKNESSNPQIRRPSSYLYASYLIGSVFLLASLFLKRDRFMNFCISLLVVLYGILSFMNDRMAYDAVGVTFFSIWGKPYSKTWNEVRKVEFLVEPLISRHFVVGLVLKIQCVERKRNKDTVTTYRFPHKYYIGIEEFLSFYHENITAES